MDERPVKVHFQFRNSNGLEVSSKTMRQLSQEANEDSESAEHGKGHTYVIGTDETQHDASNVESEEDCGQGNGCIDANECEDTSRV